jgi:hypothetical protein
MLCFVYVCGTICVVAEKSTFTEIEWQKKQESR